MSKRARRRSLGRATRQGREVRQPLKERFPEEEQQPRPPRISASVNAVARVGSVWIVVGVVLASDGFTRCGDDRLRKL